MVQHHVDYVLTKTSNHALKGKAIILIRTFYIYIDSVTASIPFIDFDVCRHSADKADQFATLDDPHPTVPVLEPARGLQGPEL